MSSSHRKQQVAAALIQRHFRGFLGRKEFNHRILLRERDKRRNRSSHSKHRIQPHVEAKSSAVVAAKSSSSPRRKPRKEEEDFPADEEEVKVYKAVKKVAVSKPVMVVHSAPQAKASYRSEEEDEVDSLGGEEDEEVDSPRIEHVSSNEGIHYKHSLQRIEEDEAELLRDSLNQSSASKLILSRRFQQENQSLPVSPNLSKHHTAQSHLRMSYKDIEEKEENPLYDSLEVSRSQSSSVRQSYKASSPSALQVPLPDEEEDDVDNLQDSLDMYASASKHTKQTLVNKKASAHSVLASPMYRPQVDRLLSRDPEDDDDEHISPRYHEEEVYESDDSLNEHIRKQSTSTTKKPVMNMTNMSNKSTSKSTIRIGDQSNSPTPSANGSSRSQIPRYQAASSSASKTQSKAEVPSSSSRLTPSHHHNSDNAPQNAQQGIISGNPIKSNKPSVKALLLASPAEDSIPSISTSARAQHGHDAHVGHNKPATNQQQPANNPPENKLDSLKKMYEQNIARYFPGQQPQPQQQVVSGDPYSAAIHNNRGNLSQRSQHRDYNNDDDMMPVQPRRALQVETHQQHRQRSNQHHAHEGYEQLQSPLDNVNQAMLGRRSHPNMPEVEQQYDQAPPISGRDPYNPNRHRQQPNPQHQQPLSARSNDPQPHPGQRGGMEGGQRRHAQNDDREDFPRQSPRYSEPPPKQLHRQQPPQQQQPQPQPQKRVSQPPYQPQPQQDPPQEQLGYGYQYAQGNQQNQQQPAPSKRKGEAADLPQFPAHVNNPSVQQAKQPQRNTQQQPKPKPTIHESQEIERKLLEEIAMLDMKKAAHSSGLNKISSSNQEVEQPQVKAGNRNSNVAVAPAVQPRREKKVDESAKKEKKAFGWGARDFREQKDVEVSKPVKPHAPAVEIVKEWKQAAHYDQQPDPSMGGRQGKNAAQVSQGPPPRNQASSGASVVSSLSGNDQQQHAINMPQYLGAQPSSYLQEFSKRKQVSESNNKRSVSAGRDRRAGNSDAQSVQSYNSQNNSKKNHVMESASLPPLLPYYAAPSQQVASQQQQQQPYKHPLDNASRRVDSRHSTRSAPH